MAFMPEPDAGNVTTNVQTGDVDRPLTKTAQGVEHLLKVRLSQDELKAHLWDDLQDLLVANSLGKDSSVFALHRYIPVELYMPGEPEEIDFDFLGIFMRLLDFTDKAEWQVHAAGRVTQSSLRVPLVFRTKQRLTLDDLQEEFEIVEDAITEALRAENKTVDMQMKRAKIDSLKEQTGLARAKKRGIYVTMVGSLLAALLAVGPGSYVQVGTMRVEVGAGNTVSIKPVLASTAFVVAHLGAKPSGDPEKRETK